MLEKVGDLEYNHSKIFAGGDGRFNGTFNGKPVVVNRTSLSTIETITSDEDEDLLRVMHPNIALLLHVAVDNDFRYDAVEIYVASLDSLFFKSSNPNKYNGPSMPSNEQVLQQLANGLGYLHSLNILHGDIKPENILISSTGESGVQMKWTGFGFRQSNDSYSLSMSGLLLGSRKWWPPEMYEDGKKASEAGEVFSAGCVFLYYILGGLHPFGSRGAGGGFAAESEIAENVKIGKAVNLIDPSDTDLSISDFPFLINMIQKNPEERISLWDVIRHLKIKQLPDVKKCPLLQSLERGRMRKRKIDSNENYSFGLHLSKSDGAAVKKIQKNYCSAVDDITKLAKLDNWNIVRIFDCYEDSSYKYFRMEFCSASLDHLFLPEGDPKKYNIDSMPSLDRVFLQIVNGLQYIHENGLVHCSIKPSNVLINSNENPQIKLADFGLIETRWDHVINSSSAVSVSGFQSEHYWLAPELLNAVNHGDVVKPTKESDIFATGKVFFYYYHLFLIQNLKKISDGTREQNFKKLSKSPMKLIEKMTKEDQNTRLMLSKVIIHVKSLKIVQNKPEEPKDSKSGAIQFLRNHILGMGEYGMVFLGFWNGSIAVVKRIEIRTKTKILIEREQHLKQLVHDNVVKFYSSEDDVNFRYIAMGKCFTSLYDYCKKPQLFHGVIPMPSDKEVLLQMARGLHYIHSQKLIHRDVKPGNILISDDNPAVIKWTDLGLSKMVTNKDGEAWTCSHGTQGWRAPEVLLSDNKSLITGEKSDIFSLGCVFFFFLTPAIHPFGNFQERENNIKAQIEPNIAQLTARNHSAFAQIILGMIKYDQHLRTNLLEVIKNLNSVVI